MAKTYKKSRRPYDLSYDDYENCTIDFHRDGAGVGGCVFGDGENKS